MRHVPRLYIPNLQNIFELSESHTAHLIRVLRMNEGDQFRAFNQLEGEWVCEISSISKKTATAKKISLIRNFKDPTRRAIAFCLIKPDNTRLIIEKCTELGVTDFYPLISQYTNSKAGTEKLNSIAICASEQSERLDIPTIHPLKSIGNFAQNLPCEFKWFSAIERSSNPFKKTPDGAMGFIIGPEGGFSESEKDLLCRYTTPCSLSRNILRSETAAIIAAGQFCYS